MAAPVRQALWLVGLLAAAACISESTAATTGRQTPDALGDVDVTDPELSQALEATKAAAGKPRLFHENLVDGRPLVQPDKW